MLWTADEAAAATGGTARGDWHASGVSIDTRTLAAGDLFVALTAARDGHDFVAAALQAGAAAALVSRIPDGVADDAPLLLVDDVLAGLEALGRAARHRVKGRVVAVTGSVGKTSTKEMLRCGLADAGRVHAAEASYNNHWGVPLTLARMPAETDVAIIEIGMNHPGEIGLLAQLTRPDLAIITTIAGAHVEAFPDGLDGIAQEKAAIFEGLVDGGTAIIPAGLETTPVLLDKAQGHAIVTFGANGDVRAENVEITEAGLRLSALLHGQIVPLSLATPGKHFATNALAVLAAGHTLGLDLTTVAEGLGHWQPPAGRGAVIRVEIEGGAFHILDDAYNANPTSLAAGLEALVSMPGRRIAILGDMLELGPDAEALHRDIARLPTMRGISVIHSVGPLMAHLHEALTKGTELPEAGIQASNAEALVDTVADLVRPGDIVLVKGSLGSRVARIVDALKAMGDVALPNSPSAR